MWSWWWWLCACTNILLPRWLNHLPQILVKIFFFFFSFFVTNKSDFVLTKFGMSICRDILLTEPCNLHDLYSCTDSNERFHALLNISLFWDLRFYHLSDNISVWVLACTVCGITFSHKFLPKRPVKYIHVNATDNLRSYRAYQQNRSNLPLLQVFLLCRNLCLDIWSPHAHDTFCVLPRYILQIKIQSKIWLLRFVSIRYHCSQQQQKIFRSGDCKLQPVGWIRPAGHLLLAVCYLQNTYL